VRLAHIFFLHIHIKFFFLFSKYNIYIQKGRSKKDAKNNAAKQALKLFFGCDIDAMLIMLGHEIK
jgi:hypothetical protein